MVYVHMHYMKSWLVSCATYIAVYIEIMVLLFYYYGPRFMAEKPVSAAIDIAYYILTFVWFTICCILAARTHEMTERKSFHSQYQQEKETEEWKRFLQNIPEPIIFARAGVINFFNPATLKLFDIPSGQEGTFEWKREQVIEQLGKIKKRRTKEPLRGFIENSSSDVGVDTLFVYKKKTGKHFITIKCVKTEGDAEVIEYLFHDVTALKDLERSMAKDQCFDILLATASHDIRTPLNVMLGVIDVLEDYVNTNEGKEQINVARCCGQRMIYYLKGLTFIRQINTSTLAVNKKLFAPVDIAKGVVNTLGFSAQAKSLRLDFCVDEFVPKVMCSDKEMYSVILQNLLENAIKYTFSGSVKVDLSYNELTRTLVTSVIDTGIGMTAPQRSNVGVLFNKQKTLYNINPQGLGLGHFLAKTLSHKLDGELTIESEADKGTKAQFTVLNNPFEGACCERPMISVDSIPLSTDVRLSFACECTKVLLVDDEPFNLLVLSAYLSSINVKSDKAENGQIALDLIEKKRCTGKCCAGYSVIFMDINMPVMDGIEVTGIICEWARAGKIPQCFVIAVTAATELDNPSIYENYLTKGFTELCKGGCIIFCSVEAGAEGRVLTGTEKVHARIGWDLCKLNLLYYLCFVRICMIIITH